MNYANMSFSSNVLLFYYHHTTMYTRMRRTIPHIMNKKVFLKSFQNFTIMNDKDFHKRFSFWGRGFLKRN